ncbi:hypothetical protein ALT_4359 [Aspergillus lentulus]|uniref:Uncharacterized protein n=1 Tax=Aspergillus lentulus TaxID=293939 RepID=A0AAN4PJ08_ASPLE|nr:uncharacterized protein IFM58399_10234 [Aspergillus lentulus]KAF4158109.1 hypothetical protein CNMCM6069_004528 [Aspergillus lentulus]KAF4165307.1 hypothetical protein CNMCM6936_008009 [Aspergillus lentulus]KAF4176375.1 hypothetical protein CNMCM8060_006364 [Aspergillus lentulus]KAF4187963.1 hypothetical protein CNMCM7927_002840 [Aspergillus lentulus]KAF4194571.1 hypothetical protein CNMCM8694_007379 [Aspergillus lentulus]
MSLEYQKALSLGLIAHEDVSTLKGTAVGISPTLDGMQRMTEEPLSEWEPEEKHSGSEAKAVLLIRDEDPKELEVNGWIPLTKCKISTKIAATTWQLQPTVLTAKEQRGWNGFSYQMETSLVTG